MAWRALAAKAAVVVLAVLTPALFVGNGLYLLTHGWFVRAEYARPGFPDDDLGMSRSERVRLARTGLYSILVWHRDGIEQLRRAPPWGGATPLPGPGGGATGGRRPAPPVL